MKLKLFIEMCGSDGKCCKYEEVIETENLPEFQDWKNFSDEQQCETVVRFFDEINLPTYGWSDEV